MATKKPIKKAAAKKPAPAKKAAPVKKATKPAPKKATPVKKAVKPVAKPIAKKIAKPVTKKPTKPTAKPTAKKATKPVAKPALKKTVTPVAKKVTKPVAKPVAKKVVVVAKKVIKPAAKAATKIVAARQKTVKPVNTSPQKVEVKKPAALKVAPKKAEPKQPILPPKPLQVIKAVAKNPKDIKIPAAKPVVLPKINTKTSRKYQPDFTKSVLDLQKNDPGAPIARYSDADLQEFRELIQRKMESAKKELTYLQGLITRKDETGGDESENRYMTMEDGSLSMEREQLSQMASRQITFIDHLEKALMRIENKTYGVCRVTGKLIDKARLRAVPHATLSIEAKMGMVK
jgi:RNA polymerase-binding transcription factor DksA